MAIIAASKKERKKLCFIITPIGEKDSEIRRHADGIIKAVIEPVLKNFNYQAVVPHEISSSGSISRNIIENLYNAELVIANLSELNPNVMYELAVRHTLGKPVIIIAEKETKLPFDIADQRAIFYVNDAKGTLDLKEDLEKSILTVLNETETDNLVVRSLQDKLTLEYLINNNESKDRNLEEYLIKTVQEMNYKLNNISHLAFEDERRRNSKILEVVVLDDTDVSEKNILRTIRNDKEIDVLFLRGDINSFSFDEAAKRFIIDFSIDCSVPMARNIASLIQKVYSDAVGRSVEIEARTYYK